jgi:hypothetical protein
MHAPAGRSSAPFDGWRGASIVGHKVIEPANKNWDYEGSPRKQEWKLTAFYRRQRCYQHQRVIGEK